VATELRLTLTVNGHASELVVAPDRTLLDVLRDDLELTGTKTNCLEAECGVCTVLVDGLAVNACTMLAAAADGRHVTTIEGLATNGTLHPLQQAFIDHGAVQCGYCIPGMILSAKAYLDDNPRPTAADVREALAGNLCRCTGYQKIVDAVLAAAEVMKKT
jgi:carbon-monoxide dehydrogenase small subunit